MGIFDFLGGNQPSGTTVTGYGGTPYTNATDAILSGFDNSGLYTDATTGYVGTQRQIAEKYLAEGRDPSDLKRNNSWW